MLSSAEDAHYSSVCNRSELLHYILAETCGSGVLS